MRIVALFGEAQKGEFHTGYFCKSIEQLADCMGEPPSQESQGLPLAIQTLLFKQGVLFFRVQEEGFSFEDYFSGLNLLETETNLPQITALCLPGVGSAEVLEASSSVCARHNSILMISERDLYDYLTCCPPSP